MTKLLETTSDVLPTLNKKNVAYPPQPPPCNVLPQLLAVENNKNSVCDKHDRGITCMIVVILTWHYCVLVLYENICSKEGEVWQKIISNKIFVMLVTQGLPSFFALLSTLLLHIQRAKKVLSDSPGLVDFAIGLVNSVFTCPTGKWCFMRNLKNRRTKRFGGWLKWRLG